MRFSWLCSLNGSRVVNKSKRIGLFTLEIYYLHVYQVLGLITSTIWQNWWVHSLACIQPLTCCYVSYMRIYQHGAQTSRRSSPVLYPPCMTSYLYLMSHPNNMLPGTPSSCAPQGCYFFLLYRVLPSCLQETWGLPEVTTTRVLGTGVHCGIFPCFYVLLTTHWPHF